MAIDQREWRSMLAEMNPRLRPSLEKARADPEKAFADFIARGCVPDGDEEGGRTEDGELLSWQQNALRKVIGALRRAS